MRPRHIIAGELDAIATEHERLAAQARRIAAELRGRRSVWAERSDALREAAAKVWAYLFRGEVLPANVAVQWVPHIRGVEGQATKGAMHSGGVIQLSWSYLRESESPLSVLVHELAHARGYEIHNAEFRRVVARWCARLGVEPV